MPRSGRLDEATRPQGEMARMIPARPVADGDAHAAAAMRMRTTGWLAGSRRSEHERLPRVQDVGTFGRSRAAASAAVSPPSSPSGSADGDCLPIEIIPGLS